MPNVIVIRIIPDAPVSGVGFANYLDGLLITAFDASFDDPSGAQLGEARRIPPIVPQIPPIVPVEDPNNRIFQHYRLVPTAVNWMSVATAVIAIPGGLTEYATRDIRLTIQRAGMAIVDRNIYYNVSEPFLNDLANHAAYAGLSPSIFLSLSRPNPGLLPAANVPLPADGSPPDFTTLKAAVDAVLAADPGAGAFDIAQLSPQQCQHIAREIAWNRLRDPLPAPPRSLEMLYTEDFFPPPPQPQPSERERIRIDADRRTFEANLVGYITTHNGDAERLSRYIFSLSAAIACEQMSGAQKRVGFRLPIRPTAPAQPGKIAETEVGLTSP